MVSLLQVIHGHVPDTLAHLQLLPRRWPQLQMGPLHWQFAVVFAVADQGAQAGQTLPAGDMWLQLRQDAPAQQSETFRLFKP